MSRGFGIVGRAALCAAVVLLCFAPAQARHRHGPYPPSYAGFDLRPTLPQAAVGAASLEILAAGAVAAREAEDEPDAAFPFGYSFYPDDDCCR